MRSKSNETIEKIIDFINECRESDGSCPTLQEIADNVGIAKSSASRYIAEMKEKGLVCGSGRRNIKTFEQYETLSETVRVPMLGQVACGLPNIADGSVDSYMRLPVAIFGSGEMYMLRAKGESMIEAGIDDGDIVLVKRQDTAAPGQIVVALTGGEATLKRYYPEPEKHRVRLQPENRTMKPIYVDDCTVQGIAVKIIKNAD
ncbi:MAG: transcriptional repressor LexA [Clostridia bacterium]|nr:transcriptional repressor LexA [Clostridia bacterium]